MINFMGSIVAPTLLNSLPFDALGSADLNDPAQLEALLMQIAPFAIYVLAMIALSLAGLVLFCIQVRNVSFQAAELELTKGMKLKTVYLNPGMALFIACSFALILLSFIA